MPMTFKDNYENESLVRLMRNTKETDAHIVYVLYCFACHYRFLLHEYAHEQPLKKDSPQYK